eukprot:jgi/Chrzof1/10627/Cz05g05210.t1
MNADTILPAVSGLSNVTKQDLVDYTRSGLMTLDSQQALLPVHSSGRHPSGGHWSVLEEDPKTQGLAVGHVPDNDPREALRRQRAMFAETDIKSLHVFGPYRHYAMTKDVYNQLLNIPAKEFEGNLYKQLLSQGANADMKFMESLRQTEWEQALEAYCLDETKVQTASDGKTTLQSMYASIMFSGWGYGNRTCLANDPHLDPLNAAGNSMHDDDFGECIPGPNGEPEEGNAVVGV